MLLLLLICYNLNSFLNNFELFINKLNKKIKELKLIELISNFFFKIFEKIYNFQYLNYYNIILDKTLHLQINIKKFFLPSKNEFKQKKNFILKEWNEN